MLRDTPNILHAVVAANDSDQTLDIDLIEAAAPVPLSVIRKPWILIDVSFGTPKLTSINEKNVKNALFLDVHVSFR